MSWTSGVRLDVGSVLDFVRREIAEYDYSALVESKKGQLVGIPVDPRAIDADLARFREAIVEPYWAEIERRDSYEEVSSETPFFERCLVITDDRNGYRLAYDPVGLQFLLVDNQNGPLRSIGIRGDPVGCYLAV